MPKYWWVNHGQTFRQEIEGEYLWSPKVEASGARSQFYENLRLASPGDYVISFADARIRFIGRVIEYAASAPKPVEFGRAGANWATDGWLLPVVWHEVLPPVVPRLLLQELAPLLPAKYSPINPTSGRGNQKAYLAEVLEAVFDLLFQDSAVRDLLQSDAKQELPVVERLERAIEDSIRSDLTLEDTEKTQLLKARRGQGWFRERVCRIERACRLTGVQNLELLMASHIKPWRVCVSAEERLDGNNGLLLTPHVDLLFDRGLISFSNEGGVLVSSRVAISDLEKLGLSSHINENVGAFSERQQGYLDYHRAYAFVA